MNTLDELIEVLQGVKAGRKWGIRLKLSGHLIQHALQDLESLACLVTDKEIDRIELMPETTTCNGIKISAPLRVAPKLSERYYIASTVSRDFFEMLHWGDIEGGQMWREQMWLERGIAHATPEAAAAHGRAMCGVPT